MTFPNISKHKLGNVDFPLKPDHLDLEHDCSDYSFFFSASPFSGLSSQNFPTFRQLVAQKISLSKNDLMTLTYVQQSVIETRRSLIQCEQHVVKGLYVACHCVTFDVPDCGLLLF